jgi:hypothetical protein
MRAEQSRITLSIPADIHKKVQEGARSTLRSISSYVAIILKEYFESKTKDK